MTKNKKILQIEGWRGINHSYALVNQFQLLEILKNKKMDVQHLDKPFLFNWSASNCGSGLNAIDVDLIKNIPESNKRPDCILRICAPIDLRSSIDGVPICVFIASELGLDETALLNENQIIEFEKKKGVIVTCSNWSRQRIINFGFEPSAVHVIPHATNPEYFHPIPPHQAMEQRRLLGIRDDEIVLLNIAPPLWNKGIDILLKAFAIANQHRNNLRLIIKDQHQIYGLKGVNFIQEVLNTSNLLSPQVLSSISVISSNLNMPQMRGLYSVADYYASPYRAEGFNLPVLEAMACGTPVIVTAGGATDDFVEANNVNYKIKSQLFENTVVRNKSINAYLEPDLDDLTEIFLKIKDKASQAIPKIDPFFASWKGPTEQLEKLLNAL
jgi:glycosyltransferase involved in cell wall biosynthesis